jgi:hypothetical protein
MNRDLMLKKGCFIWVPCFISSSIFILTLLADPIKPFTIVIDNKLACFSPLYNIFKVGQGLPEWRCLLCPGNT